MSLGVVLLFGQNKQLTEKRIDRLFYYKHNYYLQQGVRVEIILPTVCTVQTYQSSQIGVLERKVKYLPQKCSEVEVA